MSRIHRRTRSLADDRFAKPSKRPSQKILASQDDMSRRHTIVHHLVTRRLIAPDAARMEVPTEQRTRWPLRGASLSPPSSPRPGTNSPPNAPSSIVARQQQQQVLNRVATASAHGSHVVRRFIRHDTASRVMDVLEEEDEPLPLCIRLPREFAEYYAGMPVVFGHAYEWQPWDEYATGSERWQEGRWQRVLLLLETMSKQISVYDVGEDASEADPCDAARSFCLDARTRVVACRTGQPRRLFCLRNIPSETPDVSVASEELFLFAFRSAAERASFALPLSVAAASSGSAPAIAAAAQGTEKASSTPLFRFPLSPESRDLREDLLTELSFRADRKDVRCCGYVALATEGFDDLPEESFDEDDEEEEATPVPNDDVLDVVFGPGSARAERWLASLQGGASGTNDQSDHVGSDHLGSDTELSDERIPLQFRPCFGVLVRNELHLLPSADRDAGAAFRVLFFEAATPRIVPPLDERGRRRYPRGSAVLCCRDADDEPVWLLLPVRDAMQWLLAIRDCEQEIPESESEPEQSVTVTAPCGSPQLRRMSRVRASDLPQLQPLSPTSHAQSDTRLTAGSDDDDDNDDDSDDTSSTNESISESTSESNESNKERSESKMGRVRALLRRWRQIAKDNAPEGGANNDKHADTKDRGDEPNTTPSRRRFRRWPSLRRLGSNSSSTSTSKTGSDPPYTSTRTGTGTGTSIGTGTHYSDDVKKDVGASDSEQLLDESRGVGKLVNLWERIAVQERPPDRPRDRLHRRHTAWW
ncbi:MAG: hypothetical protein MHM6MM_002520 [Cercozoa sp. M6MM]